MNINFYSHTSCEVRPKGDDRDNSDSAISTHTPHARCDSEILCQLVAKNPHFYSHTSCEVRQLRKSATPELYKFLLTHLMRGATRPPARTGGDTGISTHTPHARCDGKNRQKFVDFRISTHTPHARCDTQRLLTLFMRMISTHTPHARCDNHPFNFSFQKSNFYSHTSCEVRHSQAAHPQRL